jgi:hypothetical protein
VPTKPVSAHQATPDTSVLLPLQANVTLTLAQIWRSTWATMGANTSRIQMVATAWGWQAIPYVFDGFKSSLSQLSGIAVSGTYGSLNSYRGPVGCPFEFNSQSFPQEEKNWNITREQIVRLVRGSVIGADMTYNKYYNQAAAKGLRLMAIAGGPDLQAATYGARDNYAKVSSCSTYPCTVQLFAPSQGTVSR